MLLKNFYIALAAHITKSYDFVKFKNVEGGQADCYGTVDCLRFGDTTQSYYTPSMKYMRTAYNSYGGVIIGTGTTPPTADDYALSGNLITEYTYSADFQRNVDSDGVTFTGLYTITNIGASPFTIGEIALLSGCGNSGSTEQKALIERTVLEHPITIEPGSIGQVTYTVRMNYPV